MIKWHQIGSKASKAPPQRWPTSKLWWRKFYGDNLTPQSCSVRPSQGLFSRPSHKGGEHKLCTRLDPSSCPWRRGLVHRLCTRTPPSSSGHRWTHWGTWWCTATGPGWDLAPPSSLCKDVVRKPDDNRMVGITLYIVLGNPSRSSCKLQCRSRTCNLSWRGTWTGPCSPSWWLGWWW